MLDPVGAVVPPAGGAFVGAFVPGDEDGDDPGALVDGDGADVTPGALLGGAEVTGPQDDSH